MIDTGGNNCEIVIRIFNRSSYMFSIKRIYGKNYEIYEIGFYGNEFGNSIPLSIGFFKEPISGKLLRSWV